MSYLQNKKIKKQKAIRIIILIVILLTIFYFSGNIFRGLSYGAHLIFKPVILVGKNIYTKFSNLGEYFSLKKSIIAENKKLKDDLGNMSAQITNYNSILDENNKLKEILGCSAGKKNLILSAILTKPNRSLYDTLIIDAGENEGISVGKNVFAFGDIPIGRVVEVYSNSSNVILFSNPGEKTEIVIPGKDVFMQIVGRGGGNFEMILPRDFTIEKGTEVHLPGITPYVIAKMETIISDPRDSFQKALLVSPVNIQELKFVEVEK